MSERTYDYGLVCVYCSYAWQFNDGQVEDRWHKKDPENHDENEGEFRDRWFYGIECPSCHEVMTIQQHIHTSFSVGERP